MIFAIAVLIVWKPQQCSLDEIQNQKIELYGRNVSEDEISHTIHESSLVTVCGIPGVGKSVLVRNALLTLKQKGYCILYLDVSTHKNVADLEESMYSKCNCLSNVFTSMMQLPKLYKLSHDDEVVNWGNSLNQNTIVFLDNLDWKRDVRFENLHNNIIAPLISKKLTGSLKVVITSRHCLSFNTPRHKILPISAIDDSSCAQWISAKYPRAIRYVEGKQLCHSLGSVPKAVEHVANFIAHPMTTLSIGEVLSKLNSSEYHSMFFFGELPVNGEDTNLVRALELVYTNLETDYKRCMFLLCEIPASNLSRKSIINYLQDKDEGFADRCLKKLLTLSFIEKASSLTRTQYYKINSFIRKYVQWCGPPKPDQSLRIMMKNFWGNYVQDRFRQFQKILTKEQNVQLAITIGSNKMLVNSLLPLLGEKFNFMSLFNRSLKVIVEQCCYGDVKECFRGKDMSDVIMAYSYLTKAVYCPYIHPVSMFNLINSNTTLLSPHSQCGECSNKLQRCGRKFERHLKESNNSYAPEAFGYYNALLITAACDSPRWQLWLYDLAMIITTATSQCSRSCNEHGTCLCGQQSSLELAVYNLLLHDYESVKQYSEAELIEVPNDETCQTILRLLSIIVQHVTNEKLANSLKNSSQQLLVEVDALIDQLVPTCYLGITNDIILPFLDEVCQTKSKQKIARLHEKQKKLIETHCVESIDEHPLIRYAEFPGVSALKTKKLQRQWTEKVEWTDVRGTWVCSVIKDKTKKCQDSFNLPLLSQIKQIETEAGWKIFQSLEFVMEDVEFQQWKEVLEKNPRILHWLTT